MIFRFALAFAVLAVSIAVPVEPQHEIPADYEFFYTVNEHSTGDIKSHQESRKGHAVTGKYELIDSDGYRRIVEYIADDTGFNAVVHREPTDIKIPVYVAKEAHYSHAAPQQQHYSHAPAVTHYTAPKVVAEVVAPAVHVPVPHYSHAPAKVQHYSHEPAHYYSQGAHLHHNIPTQQPYVAPKVAKKLVEPIVKVAEVTESAHHVDEVKPTVSIVAKSEHSELNTHVTYNAPEFNYHY